MANPTGQYYFDGADLWLIYGMWMRDREGTNALLQFPERKESVSHDWSDENGIDVDLSRVYLKERKATFNIGMAAANADDFWDKYHKFLNMLRQPGVRRVEISELDSSYYMYYESCTTFERHTRLEGAPPGSKVLVTFSITMVEPDPQLENNNVYLMDEEGRFLIT